MKPTPSIGCAVLTYNAKHHLPHCLIPILLSPLKPKVLVVDSSSNDGTAEEAQHLGAQTIVIPKASFNHGTTREFARKHLATDIVCLFTQDAYLTSHQSLEALIDPIVNRRASIAYARQLPHDGATFFEAFARTYNYPSKSHIRSIDDLNIYGIFTYFCSNSCAAYCNSALDSIGGFDNVLLGEDTVATAKLLKKGHKIAYVAEATVRHSHGYTLWQEFSRNFDIGYARKDYGELLQSNGGDKKRGKEYVLALMSQLCKESPHLIPYGFAHVLAKWSGYKIGSHAHSAPLWVKRLLSSHKAYWS